MKRPGALNLRGVGGLPTTDGRRVRPGVLFRSGTPQLLSEDDGRALTQELDLQLVADLRTPTEAASEGEGGLAVSDHRRVSAPLVVTSAKQEGSPVPRFTEQDPLVPHYMAYLESSQDEILTLFRALADPGGVPALMHCTAGKDRTGAAMMLVLDAVGVQRSAIAADYAAGSEELNEVFDRLIALPTYGERLSAMPVEAKRAEPDTALRYLAELDRRHGGARAWLLKAGLSAAELDALREQLTEPV